jgi:hypothetical protein
VHDDVGGNVGAEHPGRDPLVYQRLELVVIEPPLAPNLALLVIRQHVQGPEENDHVVEVVQAGRHYIGGRGAEPFLGRARPGGNLVQV